ncbi:MAG: site-specific integrase, partial [Porphyromonadaceae bacterium]|nr:site-specific integrase [Porphyromonadaceae bacterium]
AALKQAFIDGYLTVDLSAKVKGIHAQESRREYLTVEELNRLAQTRCDPLLKRAALFSALTGLRHCDIQKLKWSEIDASNGVYRLNFTQQKTKGVEYMPISEQAFQLCGERRESDRLVFPGLPDPSWISKPLKRWVKEAGITKRITFHCFRHTYATLQLAGGTDIYTVSKMLGHTNVRTTQVYAKVVDVKKEEATRTIKLDLPSFD